MAAAARASETMYRKSEKMIRSGRIRARGCLVASVFILIVIARGFFHVSLCFLPLSLSLSIAICASGPPSFFLRPECIIVAVLARMRFYSFLLSFSLKASTRPDTVRLNFKVITDRSETNPFSSRGLIFLSSSYAEGLGEEMHRIGGT